MLSHLSSLPDLKTQLETACQALDTVDYVECIIANKPFVIVKNAKGEKIIYSTEKHIAKGGFGPVYEGYQIQDDFSIAEHLHYAVKLILTDLVIDQRSHQWQHALGTEEHEQEVALAAAEKLRDTEVAAIHLSYDPDATAVIAPNNQVGVVSTFLSYPDLIPDPIQDDKGGYRILPPDSQLSLLSKKNQYKLIKSLFEAEAKFHAAGLIHGDIRGSNVKLILDEKQGGPKVILLDFGNTTKAPPDQLVKFKDADIGCSGYMMPEYYSDTGVMISHKTDVRAALPLIYVILGQSDPWSEKNKILNALKIPEAGTKAFMPELDARYVFNKTLGVPDSKEAHWPLVSILQKQFFDRLEHDKEHLRPTSQDGVAFYEIMERLCDKCSNADLAKLAAIASGVNDSKLLDGITKFNEEQLAAVIKMGRFGLLESNVIKWMKDSGLKQDELIKAINAVDERQSNAKEHIAKLIAAKFYHLESLSPDTIKATLKEAAKEMKTGQSYMVEIKPKDTVSLSRQDLRFIVLVDNKKSKMHIIYDENEFLARGAMGDIYKGYQVDSNGNIDRNKVFAIKKIYPDKVPEAIEWVEQNDALTIQSEIEDKKMEIATRVVQDELQVIKATYDKNARVIAGPDHVVIASAFLPYPDLAKDPLLDSGRKIANDLLKMSYKERVQLIKSMFSEIAKLHAKGYVHGDVRASNIKLNHTQAILLDFGNTVKCKEGQRVEFKKDEVGSAGYMMPEYYPSGAGEKIKLGHKTDVRACVPIIYLIYGEPDPFAAKEKVVKEHDKKESKEKSAAQSKNNIAPLKSELQVDYLFDDALSIPKDARGIEHWQLARKFQTQFFAKMVEDNYDLRPTSREGEEFFATLEKMCDLVVESDIDRCLATLAILASNVNQKKYLGSLKTLQPVVLQAIIRLAEHDALSDPLLKQLCSSRNKVKEAETIMSFSQKEQLAEYLAGRRVINIDRELSLSPDSFFRSPVSEQSPSFSLTRSRSHAVTNPRSPTSPGTPTTSDDESPISPVGKKPPGTSR